MSLPGPVPGACRSLRAWGPLLLAVSLPATLYVSTMARGLVWGDGIELAAVCATLGIAHPTGYPLFTLVGHLFTRIPLGSPVFRVTLLCALVLAVACGLLYRLLLELAPRRGDARAGPSSAEAPALAGALAFAFASAPWSHATRIEVYGLLLLLQLAFFAAALGALEEPSRASCRARDLTALLWGLGLGHHLLALSWTPVALAALFGGGTVVRSGARRWIRPLGFFILGLSPILYLPLRARSSPALSFGDPSTLGGWLWSLSGGRYLDRFLLADSIGGGWSPRGLLQHLHERGEDLARYGAEQVVPFGQSSGLWPGVAVVGLLLLGLGARRLYGERPQFVRAWMAMGGLYLLALTIYNIRDIADYQLGLLGWMWPVGWHGLLSTASPDRAEIAHRRGVFLLLAIPALLLAVNWPRSDRWSFRLGDVYASRLFEGLPAGAWLLTDGDVATATAWYLQQVELRRPDLQVISPSLLHYHWYLRQLEARGLWRGEPPHGEHRVSAVLARLLSGSRPAREREEVAVYFVLLPRTLQALERRLELVETHQLLTEAEVVEILTSRLDLPAYHVYRLGKAPDV